MAIALLLILPAVFDTSISANIWSFIGELPSKQRVEPPNFAIGASCAIETDKLNPDYPHEVNDACSRCWAEALRTREEKVVEECTQRFFPNIRLTCKAEIRGLKTRSALEGPFGPGGPPGESEFRGCLEKYIAENDKDEKIQKEWLTDSSRSWPVSPYKVYTGKRRKSKDEVDEEEEEADQVDKMHRVIKASCAVEHLEGEPDILQNCEACLNDVVEELINKTSNAIYVIVKSQQCLKQMPKIEKACKKVINDIPLGKIRSESYKVFDCFEDYVRKVDKDGRIQKEVGDYMNKSIDATLVMGMACSMEGLSELEDYLERGEGFNVENEIGDCRRCFREDDFPVKSGDCVEWYPDTADVPTINDRSCIEAYITHRDWRDCDRLYQCDDNERIADPSPTSPTQWPNPNLPNQGACNVIQKRKYLRCLYDTALDRLDQRVTVRVSDYLQRMPQLWQLLKRGKCMKSSVCTVQ